MTCENFFIQQLHDRGLRVTPQREMVLAVMHNIEGFATADEIYARVHALCSSVDASTIYRTLDLLAEFNLVSVLDTGEGQRRYELLGIHGLHHHLHCTRCHQVVGIAHAEIRPWLEQVESDHAFRITPTSWTFSGLCRACQEQETAD